MKDLIHREDALNCFHDWVDQYGDTHSADEMIEYQRIEALPSVDGWIPCTERMPEENGNYLTTFGEHRCILHWEREKWLGVEPERVLAWMPLPAPYREEDGDDED